MNAMRLKVTLPSRTVVDRAVIKVVAEGQDGSFCLLPRHIDMTAALVPGLLSFTAEDGAPGLLGVDEGVLVKCGGEVLVATLNAVRGDDLATLRAAVHERFVELDEHERIARTALARLEAGVVRRFLHFGGRAG
jgi:F-type H+-transporting ATPase subunit epsilon